MSNEAAGQRVVIEQISPEIDGGRVPIKRVVGETVVVDASAVTEGRDAITCRLLYRPRRAAQWSEAPMQALPNDRWRAAFTVTTEGRWQYTVTGWVDAFKTWRRDLRKRVDAGEDVAVDLGAGASLIRAAARRAEAEQKKPEARILGALAQDLEAGDSAARLRLALDDELALLMERFADRRLATVHRELEVVVEREHSRYPARYEIQATFREAEAHLPAVARLGFDVLSLSPDPAPGMAEGFQRLRDRAAELGVEIALTPPLPQAPPLDRRRAFVQRLLLAATLGASYAIDSPPDDGAAELISLVNTIRRENPALQSDRGLRFHPTDNDRVLCYSKVDDKGDNLILVAVSLDLQKVQAAWLELPVDELGLSRDRPYQVHDLLTGARHLWHGRRNFVQLDPLSIPAHVFRVRRR